MPPKRKGATSTKSKASPKKPKLTTIADQLRKEDDKKQSVRDSKVAIKVDEHSPDKANAETSSHRSKASKLYLKLQEFVKLIFDRDMFNDTLCSFNLDIRKIPFGKISKSQLAKGFDALSKLEKALKKSCVDYKELSDLSSRFYTVIPHSPGRSFPLVISTPQMVNVKKDMLMVLGDIVTAQEMDKAQAVATGDEHELDKKYCTLNADLQPLPASSAEFQMINKYLAGTKSYSRVTIRSLFRVNRAKEEDRYAPFKSYKNKKMLWYGTSVAVAAATLKDGLRIMPHSGGRAGKGIYFASEAAKSLGYTRFTRLSQESKCNVGIFFLNEVAMGDMHVMHSDGEIDIDGTKAPGGKQSTWAIGQTEPDPKVFNTLTFEEGRSVDIPQGKVIKQPHPMKQHSDFHHSEYVVYNEGQVRMRYLLLLQY